jgi:hypothetical protein
VLLTTSVTDGAEFLISRAGSAGGFNRNVYQADGATLIKALADATWGRFVYDGTAAAWYLASHGAL